MIKFMLKLAEIIELYHQKGIVHNNIRLNNVFCRFDTAFVGVPFFPCFDKIVRKEHLN